MTDTGRPLRVGLVGAGVIGQLAQLPTLSADRSVTIAGVVTHSAELTESTVERWPIERGYDTAEEMVAAAALDALFVLTPKNLHTDFVTLGLESGIDVYCEKPLATTIEDATAMVELAERSEALLMVGFNRRYAEVYQRARAEFGDGRPRFVVGQKNRVGSEYRATLENGIHMVDLMRWFCGEAVEVSAVAHAPDPYQEEGTAALIQFDSGSTGLFLAARSAGEWDERLEAYGDATTVRVVAPDSVSVTRGGSTTLTEMRPNAQGWASITETAGFAPAIEHFLSCVRTREQPRTGAAEALRSQELMERIIAAAGLPLADREDGTVEG